MDSDTPALLPKRKWRLYVLLAAIVCLPFSCMVRLPAKPYGDLQKTLTSRDGNSFKLTLWSAARLINGPFFDGSSMYVQHDQTSAKLHSGDFGSGLGHVFLDPNRDFAFVVRRFEGGRSGGVMIDLRDGSMTRQSRAPDLTGWTEYPWHTRFEQLNRDQLHQRLLSGNSADVDAAKRELQIRGVVLSDLKVFASAFNDHRLAYDERHRLAYELTQFEGDVPERVVATVAEGLNDPSREINLSAAFVLGAIASDAPESVDIWYGGSERLFAKKYDRYVPRFRDWWASRKPAGEDR